MRNLKKFTAKESEDIVELYDDGLQQLEIAKKYNCSTTKIRAVLSKRGRLEKRERSVAQIRTPRTETRMWRCKCFCGRWHKQAKFYTGATEKDLEGEYIPRVFCGSCKRISETTNYASQTI